MRPIRCLSGAVAAAALIAGAAPALAQTRDDQPRLRRLDWAGRPEASGPAALRRPSPVIPHAGTETVQPVALRPARPWRPAPSVVDGRTGLTPASAYFGPEPVAAPAAYDPPPPPRAPAPVRPEPAAPSQAAPRPQRPVAATSTSAPPPRDPAPRPEPTPQPSARLIQPTPVAPTPAPMPSTPVDGAPLDPMAPRADAPIFRVQGARQPQPQTQPQPQPQTQAPPPVPPPAPQPQAVSASDAPRAQGQGARYYSVHRQAGRQPDAVAMPEQVWLDRMPVQMTETPRSEDLAAPPEAPEMMRDGQGRLRPVPQRQDDVQ